MWYRICAACRPFACTSALYLRARVLLCCLSFLLLLFSFSYSHGTASFLFLFALLVFVFEASLKPPLFFLFF